MSLPASPRLPVPYDDREWYDSAELRSYNDAGPVFTAQGFNATRPISDEVTRQQRRGYFAATSFVDAQIGRVLDALDASPFRNNTVVALWSDHGWHLGDSNSFGKYTNFETGTNAVLMMSAPAQTRTGLTTRLTELVDLFPTLVDVAGLPMPPPCDGDEPPSTVCLQGRSFASELGVKTANPPQPPKQAAFSQFPRQGAGLPLRMGYALRTARWRYVEWVGYNESSYRPAWGTLHSRELYDMAADYHETTNVADDASHAATVRALSAQLHTMYAEAH